MDRRRVMFDMDAQDLDVLLSTSTSGLSSVRSAQRANMVLMAAFGMVDSAIAEELGTSANRVRRWVARYVKLGVAGLQKDLPRGGRPADAALASRIVALTTQRRPEGATHWSTRTMARATGSSPATVMRVWRAHGLKPHLIERFKVSNDQRFEQKLVDIVGLYMNPPERAAVLCCDEKSQCQALDRTQPGLPLKKGRAATLTHDYKRNGTTCLFAALNVLDGQVISQCQSQHRHIEWLKFLRQIDREIDKDLAVHVVLDNYATHKHPNVLAWLKKHPRFHMHFTATSASWMNMVERFFRSLSTDRLERGVFRSVDELIHAIEQYVNVHNANPKPFIWTAKARDILEKVMRAKSKLRMLQTA